MTITKNLTICYIVGGDNHHYQNMFDSIKSCKKCNFDGKFLIIEFGKKLNLDDYPEYKIIQKDEIKANGKVGYLFWMQKYNLLQYVDTKYGIYVDSDTLMINNNLNELIDDFEIGICQHWWVPTLGDFAKNCVSNKESIPVFNKIIEKYKLNKDSKFLAAGVFIFKVNDFNKIVFDELFEEYKNTYEGNNYMAGITDEIFLCAILNKYKNYKIIGGGMNHSFMGNHLIDLKYLNDKFYGKNLYENEWNLITFLHCDRTRRDPSKEYSGILKEKLNERITFLLS